jgi:hypothetical protein
MKLFTAPYIRASITASVGGRIGHSTAFCYLPVKYFSSGSRGRILDDYPDLSIREYYTVHRDRLGIEPLLFGAEIPVTVRRNLKYMAFIASEYFEFEYDKANGPEIEDVLRAKNGRWNHIWTTRKITNEFGNIGEPVRKAFSPLTTMFSRTEWDFINRMAFESARGSEAHFSLEEGLVLSRLSRREP